MRYSASRLIQCRRFAHLPSKNRTMFSRFADRVVNLVRSRTTLPLFASVLMLGHAVGQSPERCEIDGKPSGENFAPAAMLGRTGVFRCIDRTSTTPLRELRYVDGQLRQLKEWDEIGRLLETEYFDSGAVRKRSRQVPYEGRAARDLEEFWDNGQLRLRGTYLADGGAQGLVQQFHLAGPIASETWYQDGKMIRRKAYDTKGRLNADEEFDAQGRLRSLMERFEPQPESGADKAR